MKNTFILNIGTLLALASFQPRISAAEVASIILTDEAVHLVGRTDETVHEFNALDGGILHVQTAIKWRGKVYMTVATYADDHVEPQIIHFKSMERLLDAWGEEVVAAATNKAEEGVVMKTYMLADNGLSVREILVDNNEVVDIALLNDTLIGVSNDLVVQIYSDGSEKILLEGVMAKSIVRPFEGDGLTVIGFNTIDGGLKAYGVKKADESFAFSPIKVYSDALDGGEVYAKNGNDLVIKGSDGFYEKPVDKVIAMNQIAA